MQKIYINSLLEKKNFIKNVEIDAESELKLDFTDVNEIRMSDIEKLIDIQKLAIFNEMDLKIENLTPAISKVLRQTGIYKTFSSLNNFSNFNNADKINKRLGLAMD